MRRFKLSFTVQTYDERRWVPGPGDGTPYAIGRRVDVMIDAESAEEAEARLGRALERLVADGLGEDNSNG